MQLQKNTSISKLSGLTKILIKTALVFLVIFIVIILIDKIDFPSPNKKIEKIIPNENLKIIK
jgi:hypothetical protein|tara:strand:+ start:245 stop:430 length:186 start_codon:yes stop_codon:yes gene_type:complete